jgi:membrane protein YqaA with SNARE-associated domain
LRFLESVSEALIAWGPPGVLLLAALDSGGIPMPVGVDLLIVAVAFRDLASGLLAGALATLGSALGCLFLFRLGRKGGEAYVDRKLKGHAGAARFRRWYERYGLLTVFVPVLTPAPLPTKIFVLLAGAMNAPRWSFLATVVAGRSIRYVGLAWLGGTLGSSPSQFLRDHGWLMAAGAVVLFAILALLIKLLGGRRAEATITSANDAPGNPS